VNHLIHRLGTWAKENKLASALLIGVVLGVLFLTGTPIWWEPAKNAGQWALAHHSVAGWVLVLAAPVVLAGYAKAVRRLWGWWRPLPQAQPEPIKSRRQTQVDSVVETIEGVQWRCTLYDGKVHQLESHCPKCLFKIDAQANQGFRRNETAYICDGCRDFKVLIPGSSFKAEDRITRLIEAAWLQRQESEEAKRG